MAVAVVTTATASATAGTVPTQLPEKIATRSGTKPDAAQPANVERLQTATFTFEGSSPLLGRSHFSVFPFRHDDARPKLDRISS
jgi:hypothetical protein